MVKTRSPGMMRGDTVMLLIQRTTTAAPMSPPAPAIIRRTSMNTYFISGPDLLGPRPRQDRADGCSSLGGAVDGHPETVAGEARIVRRRRREARQPPQDDHADQGGDAAEQDGQLEGDDHVGRDGEGVLAPERDAPHHRRP